MFLRNKKKGNIETNKRKKNKKKNSIFQVENIANFLIQFLIIDRKSICKKKEDRKTFTI